MKSEFQRGVIWINHRRLITITCNITCSGYLDGLRSFGISVRNTRVYTYLSHPYSVCDRCAFNANPLFSVSPKYYYSPQILQTHVLLEFTPFYNVESVCYSWVFYLLFQDADYATYGIFLPPSYHLLMKASSQQDYVVLRSITDFYQSLLFIRDVI